MNRKPKIETQTLITAYVDQHLTLRQISQIYGLSHVTISKRLHKEGILSDQGEWINLECNFCGRPIKITRSRWKKIKNHYCSNDCYAMARSSPGFVKLAQGQRLARVIVSQVFKLTPKNVILYKDGNQSNTDRSNLLVFKNQKDLTAYLQGNGTKVKPIWDGGMG